MAHPLGRSYFGDRGIVFPGYQKVTSQNWPADKVERWSIDRLVPYARNSRTHSEAQIAQLAASLREWGWTNPILVDEAGTIIAGHGRVEAARQLGFSEVPVMVATGWTDAQKRAYVIADNKLALNAGWDTEMLGSELLALQEDGGDLVLLGFNDAELGQLLAPFENDGTKDPMAHWDGMPEFNQDDATSIRSVIVHFADERHIQLFADLVGQTVTDKTKSIWYPAQERMDTESKRYGD
jgi:ParB-like nuclease domain